METPPSWDIITKSRWIIEKQQDAHAELKDVADRIAATSVAALEGPQN